YRGHLGIDGRQGVRIEGCGDTTVIETIPDSPSGSPPRTLIEIVDSQDITLSGLRILCVEQPAISILPRDKDITGIRLIGLSCEAVGESETGPRPAATVETNQPVIEVQSLGSDVSDLVLRHGRV